MTKPDFLVIGAQKAGTTWLYEQLRHHPDIWLPPVKELHYFDRTRRPLILDAFRGRRQRFMLWRWLKPALQSGRHKAWYARFFLQPRSDSWYTQCFPENASRLSGDITPAYARMDDDQIARAARLLPNAKIVYVLRNPIERMWSQAAMYFSRYGHNGLERQSEAAIRRFLQWDFARANSDYLTNIERWQRHYPEDRMHIAFFDQLRSDPDRFLTSICDFLGVSHPPATDTLAQKVHSRDYPDIPATLLHELHEDYLPLLQALDAKFANEYTGGWLEHSQSR